MGKNISENRINTVLHHYVAAALWSSTNPDNEEEEFLDENYSIDDIDEKLLESMKSDIKKFISENYDAIEKSGMSDEQLGHDLWLTRNGHGAGFWDRGYEKEVSDKLSDAAREMKGTDLYVGDDEKIHALQVYSNGGGVESSFSNDTDKWFDEVSDNSYTKKFQSNEMFLEAVVITNKEATKINLGRLRALILAIPFSKKVKDSLDSQIQNILDGKYKGEFRFSFGGRRSGGGRTSAASEFFSMFHQAASYNIGDYSKGGGVGKGKIKFFEVADRIKRLQYDVDPTDFRLHSEESFRWGAKTEKDYKAAEKEIDSIKYKGKGWEIYGWYDVSGYDYWMKRQEETNYIQLTVAFDKDTIDESEVEKIDKALDSALADADAIQHKYDYDPYYDKDEEEMKRGGGVKISKKEVVKALEKLGWGTGRAEDLIEKHIDIYEVNADDKHSDARGIALAIDEEENQHGDEMSRGGKVGEEYKYFAKVSFKKGEGYTQKEIIGYFRGASSGISVTRNYSPYQYHFGILIKAKDKKAVKEAIKILKSYGIDWVRDYSFTTELYYEKGGEFGNWEGTDMNLEISLEEYGFVARKTTKDYPDEYQIVYRMGDVYGYSFVREKFLNDLINAEEWASEDDVKSFLSFVGMSKEEWLESSFVNKLHDTISYWGFENMLGTEYHPNDKKWAYEFIGIEDSGDYAKGGAIPESHKIALKKIESSSIIGADILDNFVYVKEKYNSTKHENVDELVKKRKKELEEQGYSVKTKKWNFEDLARGYSYSVTAVKEKEKMNSGGGVGHLTNEEISIIDERIDYYFDNNEYTNDVDVLASFVIQGGEIDSSKYNEIKKYIETQNYQNGGVVGDSRPEHYRYLEIQKVKGGLQISLNEEGIELVKELKEEGQSDWDIWSELFESVQGNSEYIFHSDMGDSGFGLTSAEGITDGFYYNGERGEMYKTDYPESAKVYWFPNYMIQSPLDIMIEKGSVVFDEAQSNESEMKNGGGVNSDCGCVHSDVYNSIVDCMKKGREVSVEALTLYLDRKPKYEEEIAGGILRKCYLRPYYKTK